MKSQSKRYRELLKSKSKEKKIELKEIIDLVKKNSTTKFDESIDVSLRINLKQSKGGDFSLRTVVKLPNGSGKKEKVAVICEPEKIEEDDSTVRMLKILKEYKNIILEGVPGTGKTHAYQDMLGKWDSVFAESPLGGHEEMTFHPSTSYEDFVEGIRPTNDPEIPFQPKKGFFRNIVD